MSPSPSSWSMFPSCIGLSDGLHSVLLSVSFRSANVLCLVCTKMSPQISMNRSELAFVKTVTSSGPGSQKNRLDDVYSHNVQRGGRL